MSGLKSVWDNASKFGRVVMVGTAVLIVLFVIGAAIGDSENGDDGDVTPVAATEVDSGPTTGELRAAREGRRKRKIAERQEREEEQKEAQLQEQEAGEQSRASAEGVREALGDETSSDFAVGDSEVRSVDVAGPVVNVTLSTPEGGFEGASTDDTDALASAALAKVYEDGGWQGSARVTFRGGLIDSATGREMPSAPTASYSVDSKSAKQIDWTDEEALYSIDWGLYRELCHPALKGC